MVTSIKPNERPELIVTLLGGNIFVPDQWPTLTGIALVARVRNAGAPSIATDYKLSVVLPDRTVPAQIMKAPPQLTLNRGAVTLRAAYLALEQLTQQSPLKPGDPPIESGILFYVPLPKSEVQRPDAILELSLQDFAGHVFIARQRMGDWLQADTSQPKP